MEILMVSPNIPSPTWGASTRNYHLLKALAREHAVTLLGFGGLADEEASGNISLLKNLVRSVQMIPYPEPFSKRRQQFIDVLRGRSSVLKAHTIQEMQRGIDTALANGHYHAVLFESVLMAGYLLPKGIRVIIDEHNIEYELRLRTYRHEKDLLRKWFNRLEGTRIKPFELEQCRNADIVLVTSERERLLLQAQLPECVIEVVPNGVDIGMFDVHDATREVPGRIVFTGSMEYYPNVHAALFFAQNCWPLIRERVPHATWHIVGKNPLPEVRKLAELTGVTVTGTVPDVRPYIASAEVCIVPLLIGSGTRLKILEALAMQKAVVSTSIGCEGLAGVPGKHWVVADEPEAFAQSVMAFMNNAEMRKRFGNAGRALVEAEYSWKQCGTRLLQALEKCDQKR